MDPYELAQAKRDFLDMIRGTISKCPTWAPEAAEAMSDGIADALAEEKHRRYVIEKGFAGLLEGKRVLKVRRNRREDVKAAIDGLCAYGNTPFQRQAQEAFAAGEKAQGRDE